MAVLTGLAVFFVILAPTSGAADHCYSLVAFMGVSVPCEGGVAIAGGVAAGGLVALAAWSRSPIARPIPG